MTSGGVGVVISHVLNVSFLLLPIHSLLFERTGNSGNEILFWERGALLVSFVLYFIGSMVELNRYMIVYFVSQISVIVTLMFRRDIDTGIRRELTDAVVQRGLLLQYDESLADYRATGQTVQKKPSQNLDFYISTEEDDEDFEDDLDDGIEGQLDDATKSMHNRNRLKLNAPVLATLLALSPVHTEAVPINSSIADPIDTAGSALAMVQIIAFSFILVSKAIPLLVKLSSNGMQLPTCTTAKTDLFKTAVNVVLVALAVSVADNSTFAFRCAGHMVFPYCLLILNCLSFTNKSWNMTRSQRNNV